MKTYPQRKTIRLPRQAYRQGNAFFVTIDTHGRHPWFTLYPEMASACLEILKATAKKRGTRILAWCLMPDHLHLLLQDIDLIDFVRLFKGRTMMVARRFDPQRPLWQRSFYDHGLRTREASDEVARYILENPVRAGIVNNAVDYPWSGTNTRP